MHPLYDFYEYYEYYDDFYDYYDYFFLIEHLHHQKKFCVCVCMYKLLTYSIKTWKNIAGVEVIKYNGKKWINEKNLETALGCKI